MKRYWLFSAWECHEPMELIGRFIEEEEAMDAVPDDHEMAILYDVLEGRKTPQQARGWSGWRMLE